MDGCPAINQEFGIIRLPVEEAVNRLSDTDYGIHYMVVYNDLDTLRQFYSMYIKKGIEEHNETVVYASFYETTESVRNTLSSGHTAMDVSKYEKSQSLALIDSLKVYYSEQNVQSIMKTTTDYAKRIGKTGVTLIGDTAAFQYMLKRKELVDYEMSLPTSFGDNRKVFCLYHRKDLDRLSSDQKEKLLAHHAMTVELQCV